MKIDLATTEWLLGNINIIADTRGNARAKIGERYKCPVPIGLLDEIEKRINRVKLQSSPDAKTDKTTN